MSRSRFYKLRKQKKLKKIQIAHNIADCQYAKIILSDDKKFNCLHCFWFFNLMLYDGKNEYWTEARCKNKYRIKKGEYSIELPEEKFCGFFKELQE